MIYIGKLIDLTGQRFGRLTVLERSKNRITPSGQIKVRWLCKCDCGNETIVDSQLLRNGRIKSCGCSSNIRERNITPNIYDLSDKYGVGYTENTNINGVNCFYFDIDDYNKIKNFHWWFGAGGYIVSKRNGRRFYLHRIISQPQCDEDVDHINHHKYDNRKFNLRNTTRSQNTRNRMALGVCQHKKTGHYEAYITVDYKRIYLGVYDNLEDAITARKEAEEKYFGEYSYDNSIGVQEKDKE